ncbi:Fe3+ hydroxamate ABC transporter substrate-binding protein [Psychrobacter ciconiae]|uniref:Fe3+ hydroxamate ABC transporter substrate-binding protein n=1 Tax=Psychrobacter ciconiae TaxID=1553449 RepID=UPI001D12E553|nr:Fe3+ hydroxamate ABC transporter substrate-binding protein [Psychrobacter ciconiae]
MIKRPLYCANCGREVSDGETIFAKMTAPKNIVMVEIKAYLKKNSIIFCEACFKNESAKL